jgi:hypothetical protein
MTSFGRMLRSQILWSQLSLYLFFLNYICSQSAHRSMGQKLIKCKNYESSESNCDSPQNNIFFS